MTINVLTLFPDMFDSVKASSIWARAIDSDNITINTIDIRDFATDKHNRADDSPFGGGAGMVLKPEPVSACFDDVTASCPQPYINVYMSPCGKTLSHDISVNLSKFACINILCGHYEGVDQRAIDKHIDLEISIGDYVLTGGELAAMVVIDACMRHIDGVLGNETSTDNESFSDALLEHPQYTRPASYNDVDVPDVLLSGHHANVQAYSRQMSILMTARRRPGLLSKTVLGKSDIEYITRK
ncbi:MAG: tRNA (guanosine(37)-N1)-methyltransferase TrmD [Clostridia bacterium]|jgi:tRNA (guanine37-N1)-methyltransferase|nr:tRNA (guanosine(37)-N1)-methyltransferase TrmD [Clostridia bacterium]